jgi:hypothetical protein
MFDVSVSPLPTSVRSIVIACLLGSLIALAAAPLVMPDSYSWIADTTSESAAQGLDWAWVARLGFVTLGTGVILLAAYRRSEWGEWGASFHFAFGILMLAAAVFSNRPIEAGVPADMLEDTIHSVAASLMGFAFAGGVVAVVLRRRPARPEALDFVAVIASAAIPLGMAMWPESAGLLQRVMFLIAYAWHARQALGSRRRWATG